jgi:mannose-6-phosphate isomerase-like protein (cupin superfamily)
MPDATAPDGSEVYFLVPPHETRGFRGDPGVGDAGRASLVEVRLPAGRASRPVRHRTVEEIWYFVAGRGQVWRQPPDGGEPVVVEVGPGRALVIPTGWAFQFRAEPGADLRFLCYTSPPWPGDDEAVRVATGAWQAPPN